MKIKGLGKALALSVAVLAVGTTGVVSAAPNSTLNQVINTGVLSTDIMDASRVPVASPSVNMTAKNLSFDCQAGGNASTGTFGTNTERIYVTNPDGADNGWTLTLAATGGATALWQNGGATQNFDFNDVTGGTAGCADGGDADSRAGQLTVNPSGGTLTSDCVTCGNTGISLGGSAAYDQGVTDSITLINAGSTSDDIWRGYLTGVSLSQTIPAETAVDTYSINMTLTATAS